MVFFDNSKFLDPPLTFLSCIVLLKTPLIISGIFKLFFANNNIKFGALEWLFCNFLLFGLVVVFFAFTASEMKKDGAT